MDSVALFALLQQAADTAGTVSGVVNYSVSIGDLISAGTSIVAVLTAYTKLTDRLKAIEVKSEVLWEDWKRRQLHTREHQ